MPLVERETVYDVELVTPIVAMPPLDLRLPVRPRFLIHAGVVATCGDSVTFATDPWVLGPAFCNGWWLSRSSPDDALEAVNACDIIYFSHNHPDHLHEETLNHLRRDMQFVVPAFATNGVGVYLRSLGFTNVVPCEFGLVYQLGDASFHLSIFKSGDFRDDSGLWFHYGSFSAVMSVDCNALNAYNLPNGVTFLATSFAGGASGFPLCFWNYSLEDRRRIVTRNKGAMRHNVSKYLEAVQPRYYMPYAGYFTEDPERDSVIYENNRKNSAASYAGIAAKYGAQLIGADEADIFEFQGRDLVKTSRAECAPAKIDRDSYYAAAETRYGDVVYDEIESYFSGAGFKADLLLYLNLTDTSIETSHLCMEVDFRAVRPTCQRVPSVPSLEEMRGTSEPRKLVLHIRKEAFGRIVRELLPWEDMIIGFQVRVERWPNTFNSDLWYYFTNVYIKSRARRAIDDCGQACERIAQYLY